MNTDRLMPRTILLGVLALLLLALVACDDGTTFVTEPSGSAAAPSETDGSSQEPVIGEPVTSEGVVISDEASSVPSEIPPSPTPTEPMAALVNDEPIFLAAYEKELARYERAQVELGLTAESQESQGYRALVLNALVERVLISQAAAARGIVITPAIVDQKLAELQTAAGDTGNFAAWLEANLWTEEEFREALAVEILTEQIVSVVTADVPRTVEQVRARYLQVDDLSLAQSLLQQIRNGEDFATLAGIHSLDQVTGRNGGELGGYFARGSLLVPAVETAAFALNPGEISEIISGPSSDGSQTTYYLVQLIERDPQRPLTAAQRYTLLQQAFEAWLQAEWEQATVVRLVNTDT